MEHECKLQIAHARFQHFVCLEGKIRSLGRKSFTFELSAFLWFSSSDYKLFIISFFFIQNNSALLAGRISVLDAVLPIRIAD